MHDRGYTFLFLSFIYRIQHTHELKNQRGDGQGCGTERELGILGKMQTSIYDYYWQERELAFVKHTEF